MARRVAVSFVSFMVKHCMESRHLVTRLTNRRIWFGLIPLLVAVIGCDDTAAPVLPAPPGLGEQAPGLPEAMNPSIIDGVTSNGAFDPMADGVETNMPGIVGGDGTDDGAGAGTGYGAGAGDGAGDGAEAGAAAGAGAGAGAGA